MKFCNYCGAQLRDDARFCGNCGKEAGKVYGEPKSEATTNADGFRSEGATYTARKTVTNNSEKHREIVTTLSSRLRMNGIIWFIIAGIQIVIGLCGTWAPLIVGVLNIISAINDLKLSKQVLVNQSGLVKGFEPMTSTIITLVYNAVVGAVIGIGGSMYYMFAIRKYVLDNKEAFLEMEENPVII